MLGCPAARATCCPFQSAAEAFARVSHHHPVVMIHLDADGRPAAGCDAQASSFAYCRRDIWMCPNVHIFSVATRPQCYSGVGSIAITHVLRRADHQFSTAASNVTCRCQPRHHTCRASTATHYQKWRCSQRRISKCAASSSSQPARAASVVTSGGKRSTACDAACHWGCSFVGAGSGRRVAPAFARFDSAQRGIRHRFGTCAFWDSVAAAGSQAVAPAAKGGLRSVRPCQILPPRVASKHSCGQLLM
jgi:hypothetical protein